jgi:DNA-binding protein HU-beta
MNKAELINALALNTNTDKRTVSRIVETVFDGIAAHLQAGGEVSLVGFGTFSTRLRKARIGIDPRDPTRRINMPSVRVPKFKAGSKLKALVREGTVPTL